MKQACRHAPCMTESENAVQNGGPIVGPTPYICEVSSHIILPKSITVRLKNSALADLS